MRIGASAALLLPIALACGAETPLPKLDSVTALETFFFPAAEEDILGSMQAVFQLDNPGMLVTAAAKVGPEYASRVVATIESAEFRAHYAQLAEYLKLFGPCQKKQNPDSEGWWSGYTVPTDEAYCGEVTKLVFAATLWSQVHYCRQLATGEVKPKLGPAPRHDPPYRLDETPVKTHWVNADAIYEVTDAAITRQFQDVLRKRVEAVADGAERSAIVEAATELEHKPVNRELAAVALLKLMLRNYEAVHTRHLRRWKD